MANGTEALNESCSVRLQGITKIMKFATNGDITEVLRGACFSSESHYKAYNGIDISTGELYVIKELLITKSVKDNNKQLLLKLMDLEHDHLFQLKGFQYECVDEDKWKLYVLQKFDFGYLSLSLFLEKNISITNDILKRIAKNILNVVHYMTTEEIKNINIVASSTFIDQNGNVKLYNFGLDSIIESCLNAGTFYQEKLSTLSCFADMLAALHIGDVISTFSESFQAFLHTCRTIKNCDISAIEELLDHSFIQETCNIVSCLQLPDESFEDEDNLRFILDRKISRIENDYEIIEELGKGNYGKVVKIKDRLDKKYYALKKINLSKNEKENRKIIREAQLLANLEHENIVRYYHSWTENIELSDDGIDDATEDIESSVKSHHCSVESTGINISYYSNEDYDLDDDSPGVQMKNLENECSDTEFNMLTSYHLNNTLYIKMEFCESNTLMSAIDNSLHNDVDRIWRFLKEIVEGLHYIHEKGIIHRDLKPMNIFLDSKDHVKIGDFGFATTKHKYPVPKDTIETDSGGTQSGSYTDACGTSYYMAPELLSNNTFCDQKLDMYSLGIILFEMCYPPFDSGHQRDKVLTNLRSVNITFPNDFNGTLYRQSAIIRKLLHHNPMERPSCQELRNSNSIPSLEEDAKQISMICKVVDNPQSRINKFLYEYMFTTRNLHNDTKPVSYINIHGLEKISRILFDIFAMYGGEHLDLCTTSVHQTCKFQCGQCKKFVDDQGTLVVLPCNDRQMFFNYVHSKRRKTWIRRYSMLKTASCDTYSCAFDIVTPIDLHKYNIYLPDAEILLILDEIRKSFADLSHCFTLSVNHRLIFEAIFTECGVFDDNLLSYITIISTLVPKGKQRELMLSSYMNCKDRQKYLNLISILYNFDNNFDTAQFLSSFVKPGVNVKVRKAINELIGIYCCAVSLGLKGNIVFDTSCGLWNFEQYSGILVELHYKTPREKETLTVVTGGRYNNSLNRTEQLNLNKNKQYGVGITVFLGNLKAALKVVGSSPTNVTVCYCSKNLNVQALEVMRRLRDANIPCDFVKIQSINHKTQFCARNNIKCCILLRHRELQKRKCLISFHNFEKIEQWIDINDVVAAVECGLYSKSDNIVIKNPVRYEVPVLFRTIPSLSLGEKFKCKIKMLHVLKDFEEKNFLDNVVIFVVNTTINIINDFVHFCKTGEINNRSLFVNTCFEGIYHKINESDWRKVIFCNISETSYILIKNVVCMDNFIRDLRI